MEAGDEAAMAAQVILAHRGKVTVTAEHRCDDVARRLVAALSLAGVPASFLSSVQIASDDLGEYRPGDPVVMISEGNTSGELLQLAAVARAAASPVIGITDTASSRLAAQADFVIFAGVKLELHPDSLQVWMQSTVLAAMSDTFALAVRRARSRNTYARSWQNAKYFVS
jgi:D-arabinose 5-phosphate isomerase GutQ